MDIVPNNFSNVILNILDRLTFNEANLARLSGNNIYLIGLAAKIRNKLNRFKRCDISMTHQVTHIIIDNKIKVSAITKSIYHISLNIEHRIATGKHETKITLIFSPHMFINI